MTKQEQSGDAITTVLFDLDGTLADTAPDLAYALNKLREEKGLEHLPYDDIRVTASHGGQALVKLGFDLETDDPEFEPLRQRFLDLYRQNLSRETRLFPGMEILLAMLQKQGFKWGVVTNKPAHLTDPILKSLGLFERAAAVISGDTTTNRKPHPEPMLLACQQTGAPPPQCLYVGDAERDIHAGQRAGMKTLIALFGYIGDNENPESWGADGMVRTPMEILDWIHAKH
jgi:phosphoglycolate phosphatase